MGFVINPKWPHLGASPDGVVSCTCHGKGVIELKCPYSHKDDTIKDAVTKDNASCLMEHDGKLKLRRDHTYYYQIHICGVSYCDFVVCTFGTSVDIFVEQDNGLWDNCLKTATAFFSSCILPELLGHWYTRPECGAQKEEDCKSESSDEDHLYCFCNQPSEGEMIGCDNPDCKIEWFHTKCLKMKTIPTGRWYCKDCQSITI